MRCLLDYVGNGVFVMLWVMIGRDVLYFNVCVVAVFYVLMLCPLFACGHFMSIVLILSRAGFDAWVC